MGLSETTHLSYREPAPPPAYRSHVPWARGSGGAAFTGWRSRDATAVEPGTVGYDMEA